VGSPVVENKSINICQGQTYTLPSGRPVNNTGSYSDTTRSVNGCDSLISVIILTVQNLSNKVISDFICAGKTYALPSGKVVNTTGLYSDTVRYQSGCDSIRYNVSVSVFNTIVNNQSVSICAGKTYTLPGGKIVSTTGVYKDTIRFSNGCDSLLSTINLMVGQPILENKSIIICQGQTYTLPSGRIVNTTGIFNDTARSVSGCDSLISVISLTVQNVSNKVISDFICAGKTYVLPSGKIVNTTGMYSDTVRYQSGCDSIHYNVSVSVFNTIVNNQSVSICAGKTYSLAGGKIVSTTGVYKDTIRFSNGCDSLLSTINLMVGQPVRETTNPVICQGQSFRLPGGRVVSTAGNYIDTARASSGCDSLISTVSLRVDSPQQLSISNTICGNDVYISPGGKKWNVTGIYKDTLRNTRGCDSLQFIINLEVQNAFRTTIDTTICSGSQYKLPTGKFVTVSGSYTDTIQSKSGCDSVIITNLLVHPKLNVDVSGISSICEGYSTSITATASGGNGGPYSISWSNNAGNSNVINVSPSTNTKYVVTLNDGCTKPSAMDSIIIQVTPKPNAAFTTNKTSGCEALQIQFSNGNNVLNSHWNFGTGIPADTSNSSSPLFTFTKAGSYTASLQVSNQEGCTSSSNTTIVVYPTPQSDFLQPGPACVGSSISLNGIVKDPTGITWLWNFGNGQTSNLQNPAAQRFTTAGNYQINLVVKNAAGCSDTTSRTLVVQPVPVPGINNAQVKICLGSSILLQAKDGVSYSWSPATGLTSAAVSNPTANPTTDTRYKVTVTNAAGCTGTDSLLVKVTQPFSLRASSDTIVCIGKSVTLTSNGALRYLWSGAGVNQTSNSVTVKPTNTTTYTVTGFGADSCFTQIKSVTVTVIPLPTVDAGNDTTVMVGSSFALKPAYSPDVTKWIWTPSQYLDCIDCPSPVSTPRSEVNYLLTVQNQYQCEASDSRTVKLLCNNESIFLPNTFTPNGDGTNDVWYPRGRGISAVRYLRVFNRWGQLIFERQNFNADDRSAGWDGTYKGQKLPPDVFVYSLGMICDNGQLVDVKGNVMIVR
jgi:gliding motility-associated-like protein